MRHKHTGMAALGLIAAAAAALGGLQDAAQGRARVQSQIRRGYEINPVPLNLKGKNVNLVGLGSYLVNSATGCNECHTNPPFAPGGNPYFGQPKKINAANFMGGGVNFGPLSNPPGLVSPNTSPDANGMPAGHSFPEFMAIMQDGLHHHHGSDSGHHDASKEQLMPWPVYRHMTELDIRAIYEYLKAIPHAEPGVAPPPPGGPAAARGG
jgi:hypothetical protein